ncbi:MAG: hypothetical protein WA151_18860 [Desulfatirhabdiaceae bacterium]
MTVSDFVALVKHLLNMDMAGLITLIIIAVVAGAITQKVVSGLQSVVVLMVANLIALLVCFEAWQTGTPLGWVVSSVCLAVAGHGLYQRVARW